MPIHQQTSGITYLPRFALRPILASLLAISVVAPAVTAAENPGAHEHGHARLQMALEEKRIDLLFSSPAHNLAGFEHEARTAQENKQLADIRQWLETNPLIRATDRNCRVVSASIELGGSTASHDDHDDHDDHEDHHQEEHHHGEAHHDDSHNAEESTHRDYEVSQQLACDGVTEGQNFLSPMLEKFPELRELSIEWVSGTGQGSVELTSPNQTFSAGE